ncbi:hypothetical protein CEXT_815811 [Caerostris extrusa]|uniref:Ribosomal protein L32 n=1 Tax=Caerostris extrusa TaxID=172846 RepID=A0AAV4YA62_CAEEX|nr:hypothetical protein CEXT_815811 [Caerostris extrusa]
METRSSREFSIKPTTKKTFRRVDKRTFVSKRKGINCKYKKANKKNIRSKQTNKRKFFGKGRKHFNLSKQTACIFGKTFQFHFSAKRVNCLFCSWGNLFLVFRMIRR